MAEESGGNDKVIVVLDLDAGTFEQKLQKADGSLQDFSDNATKRSAHIGSSFLEINAALELMAKAAEAAKFAFEHLFLEPTKLAMQSQQALVNMNSALANAGLYSKGFSKELDELANHLEKTSFFSSETVMQAAQIASQYAKNEDQVKKLTQASIEYSAATGKDLNTSIRTLGMSLDGYKTGLTKVVPGLEKMTDAQLRAGAAVDAVAGRFAGSASAQTETFGGRVHLLKGAFEDLEKAIGKMVVNSPALNGLLEGLKKGFGDAAKFIEDFAESGGFEKIIHGAITFGINIVNYVLKPLEFVINVGKILFSALEVGFDIMIGVFFKFSNAIVQYVITPVMDFISLIGKAVSLVNSELGSSITKTMDEMSSRVSFASQNMADEASKNAEKSANAVADNIKKVFDFSYSDKIEARLQELQGFADRGAKIGEGIVAKNKVQIEAMNDAMKKMISIVQSGIVSGIANSFSALGAALAKGKNGFEAFSNAVISSLGALAIQMGSMLVAIGLGFEALGPVMPVWGLSGAKAVAAGIGLIALGGALQAMGGGGEASASGGGGGGGGFGGGANATPEAAKPEQMEKKKADIIINGDFLNTRETANHLAEILRENSDITDYTITAQGRAYA